MVASRSIHLDESAIRNLIGSRSGPVGQFFAVLGREVTREAQRIADNELDPGSSSPGYHNAFSTTTRTGTDGPRTTVTNKAPHAGFLERGSRPHVIRARRARVLRFTVGGQERFATSVQHPGTRPYRIMERALAKVMRRYR